MIGFKIILSKFCKIFLETLTNEYYYLKNRERLYHITSMHNIRINSLLNN